MIKAQSLETSLEIMRANHKSLTGSKEEQLEIACENVMQAFDSDPSSVLGPFCEQLTTGRNKSHRMPYINVSQWIYERSPGKMTEYITKVIRDYKETNESRRKAMGACILIRSLGISSFGRELTEILCDIVGGFESNAPSQFEGEIFNTTLFLCHVNGLRDSLLKNCIERFEKWTEEKTPIASVSAKQLLNRLNDDGVVALIPLMRFDIPSSSERCQSVWQKIAPKPFDNPMNWIELGLNIGRADEESIRKNIATLASDKGQFSSIISVALSVKNPVIQQIARALFRFGIHGKEAASFDPNGLSQLLEQKDDLTSIAITFLGEMALANADKCIPQLFPLLLSDKPVARKNALELLSHILTSLMDERIKQMIAVNLLPLVADEAISVRVDIPGLFVSISPDFIVPLLIKMLGDQDEKKRSTASASIERIMKETKEPSVLLKVILDCALGLRSAAPQSPAEIDSVTPEEREKDCKRVLKLIEKWATDAKGTMFLNPTPVLNRLWADPKNDVIVQFMAKSTPLYDVNILLAGLLQRLQEIEEKKPTDIFVQLAPLLVLRPQPIEFFTSREVMASGLFDRLFVINPNELQQVQRLRGELLGRFDPYYVVKRVLEVGLFQKFCLFVICMAGTFHDQVIPDVCDEFEKEFYNVSEDLFIPICDAFYFADRERAIAFGIRQDGTRKAMILLDQCFQKFMDSDAERFCKSGSMDALLKMNFKEEDAPIALRLLTQIACKCQNSNALDSYWEQMFEAASFYWNRPQSRLQALGVLAGLMVNQATEHVIGNFDRIRHMAEVSANDSDPQVRKVGQTLLEALTPAL